MFQQCDNYYFKYFAEKNLCKNFREKKKWIVLLFKIFVKS